MIPLLGGHPIPTMAPTNVAPEKAAYTSSASPRPRVERTSKHEAADPSPAMAQAPRSLFALFLIALLAITLVSASHGHDIARATHSTEEKQIFQEMLNSVDPQALRGVLLAATEKYKHGVFQEDRKAMEALHQENAEAATYLLELAKRQSGNTTAVSTSGSSPGVPVSPSTPVAEPTTTAPSPTPTTPGTTSGPPSPSAAADPTTSPTPAPASTSRNQAVEPTTSQTSQAAQAPAPATSTTSPSETSAPNTAPSTPQTSAGQSTDGASPTPSSTAGSPAPPSSSNPPAASSFPLNSVSGASISSSTAVIAFTSTQSSAEGPTSSNAATGQSSPSSTLLTEASTNEKPTSAFSITQQTIYTTTLVGGKAITVTSLTVVPGQPDETAPGPSKTSAAKGSLQTNAGSSLKNVGLGGVLGAFAFGVSGKVQGLGLAVKTVGPGQWVKLN
ncbi:hypothetical protein LZ554_009397 [Drepanopeziza brunnea f. sp. 'monogermtubi']|nr:hypothetical protein LZ554_009397 [Drepanopeziza brunnea f. sp. 'monogermtubi']